MPALSREQTLVLGRLTGLLARRGFVLAGGCGVGLLLGHRRSLDLGFFCTGDLEPQELLEELRTVVSFERVLQLAQGTLTVAAEGTTLSFFHHAASPVAPPLVVGDATVAAPRDLAAKKLLAIAGRGARKDFVDLHALCTGPTSLPAALDAFDQRYSARGYDRYHLLRSLTYFRDAEQDPMPTLSPAVPWAEIRGYFERHVPELLLPGERC